MTLVCNCNWTLLPHPTPPHPICAQCSKLLSCRKCAFCWTVKILPAYTCIYVYAYVYMCICIYVHMYICINVNMCICVYVYMLPCSVSLAPPPWYGSPDDAPAPAPPFCIQFAAFLMSSLVFARYLQHFFHTAMYFPGNFAAFLTSSVSYATF